MSTSIPGLPPTSISIFQDVASFRSWRNKARDDRKTVGFVATMGALHDGHLSLVRRSLAENDLTVLSIFVNPAQFAPHEDLATYPRTLPDDLAVLNAQRDPATDKTVSALFLPSVLEMYPSGISQDVASQLGTFVEVKGFGHQMEGKSRPTFFRGVATVVTKLFNAIEPTNAYFGQKDIQQALILRRLSKDLLLSHPDPDHLHIVPTTRDSKTGLALSSRNAYLSPVGRAYAPVLYAALSAAKAAWSNGRAKSDCIAAAHSIVDAQTARAVEGKEAVSLRLDYIEMNDAQSFEIIDDQRAKGDENETVILSGALWVDQTRLIDNIILGKPV